MEITVDYEIRRRIRSQIRLVKRLINENKLETVVTKKTKPPQPKSTRPTSPERNKPKTDYGTDNQTQYIRRTSSPSRVIKQTDVLERRDSSVKSTEYQTSYSYNERRTSSEMRSHKTERRSHTPETISTREKSPEKRTSPERKPNKSDATKVFQTELKRVQKISKTVSDDKPEWVTQRNLRKVTDKTSPVRKVPTKKETVRSSSPIKEKTDVITSSYGVGPMDENGTPLFGLKALRAQNKIEQSKG